MKLNLDKPFYLIAKYWLGDIKGFIKLGDGCRYKCIKKNRIDDVVSMNCKVHYEKCKESEKE